MSRRRSSDSSLELLLDTITNTFGGVLFVAMLVSLMLRTVPVGQQGEQRDPGERARLEAQLVKLRERKDNVTERLESLRQSEASGDKDALSEAEALQVELLSLANERTESVEAIARHQASAARDAARVAELSEASEEAESAFESSTQLLDNEKAESERLSAVLEELGRDPIAPKDIRAVGLPTLTELNRLQVGVMARYGRLYMMHKWRNGVRTGPNTDDFVVSPGPPQVARARPNRGVPTDVASVQRFVQRLAADFPPDQTVIAIVVHADSFGSFATVRKALIEAGYKYSPIPLPPGGAVVDEGGRSEGQ
jgi:hypothetical protein